MCTAHLERYRSGDPTISMMGLFARRHFDGPKRYKKRNDGQRRKKKKKSHLTERVKPGEVICRYSEGKRYVIDEDEYYTCYGFQWTQGVAVDAASTQSGL